jgi:hypothetical protein
VAASPADPTTEQLLAFAESLLSTLGPHLRERAALEQAIVDHPDLWVMLYRASVELGEA